MRADPSSFWPGLLVALGLLSISCDSGEEDTTATAGGSGGASSAGTGGTGLAGAGGHVAGQGGSAGSSGTGGGVGGGTGGSGGQVQASAGCSKAPAVQGASDGTVMVDGAGRSFGVWVSNNLQAGEPIALAIGFHGRGGNGTQAAAWGLHTTAAYNGDRALFLYPNGAEQPEGGTGWAMSATGADVKFFDAMVDWAKAEFCIDESKVFVLGFSWGNDFANALGCFRGDVIRAVGGFSGSFYSNSCTVEVPAYFATYSTPDGTDAYSLEAMEKAVNHYRDAHGCSQATHAVEPSPCVMVDDCAKPVEYCAYPNLGHSVPTSGGKDAWNFFASFE